MDNQQHSGMEIVRTHGLELAVQSFGSPSDPAMLLIMGATASMLGWPEGLCERLARAGFHVIRYDNRDTGRSTSGPPGAPSYTLDDMADDAVRVLDAFGITGAHVVGMSLGGMIGQIAALKQPSRVLTLTVIGSGRFDETDDSLPGMAPEFMEHFVKFEGLDWSDRGAVVDFTCERARMLIGSAFPFDEAEARREAEREFDYALNPRSAFNHAMLGGGESWHRKFGSIQAPLLIIHGSEDPVLPVAHAYSMAAGRPDATMMILEGRGHELNRNDWDAIVAAVAAHGSCRRSARSLPPLPC